MQKQIQQTIQLQPNCIDANGHLFLEPIIDIAKQYDCPFIALVGEKRIGKTYGCITYALKQYYKHGYPSFYSRRYDKTFTENIVGDLVRAHRQDIINLSKGAHNNCDLRGKYFDLVRDVESNSGTVVKKNRKHFMYCRSLNNIETETADDKGDAGCIIYDEFLTRGKELGDEFNKLMILHANATGKRADRFIPMFLLGNTVTRDSAVAKCFGIDLRQIRRGVNVITNTKGQARIIVFYSPETSKSTKAAETYYDRFEDDHINMIAHGDWTLGTYKIASQSELQLKGFSLLLTHDDLAVKLVITVVGVQPVVVVKKPDDIYSIRCTSGTSKTAINFIPPTIVNHICSGYLRAESSEIGENFRDICKHLNGCERIVNYFD